MGASRDQWEHVAADPDPKRNLGYELEEWETIRVDRGKSDHVVYVSRDEADRNRESFIIAGIDAVEDLIDRR